MQKISIVIPLFNEEETFPLLYDRLTTALETDFKAFIHEIIFINDGSTDQTASLLKHYALQDDRLVVINFSRNFGHMTAITAGLDYAQGDYIVMMDGDLQDRPEDIIFMYKKLHEGFDVVYSQRLNKKFSFFKRISSFLFMRVLTFLLNEDVEMNTTIFRIMRKCVVDEVKKMREGQRYVIGLIGWVGFKHTSIPLQHAAREKGITKYTFFKQVGLALDTICSFSTYPLRFLSRLGLILIVISFCLALFIIFRRVLYGASVVGWSSLIVTIIFFGGLQVFSLGILGEYLGRSYIELKRRPLYVVASLWKYSKVVSIDTVTYEKEW